MMNIRCKKHGMVEAIHFDRDGTFGCPECIKPPVMEVTDPELIAKIEGGQRRSYSMGTKGHIEFPTYETKPDPGEPSIEEIITEGSKSMPEVWEGVAKHMAEVAKNPQGPQGKQ